MLLSQLLGPDELRSEALVTGALQCFCAAGSATASAAAAALLRRLEPGLRALQALEAHLAGGGAAELSSADRAALCALVGNLRSAGIGSDVPAPKRFVRSPLPADAHFIGQCSR